MVEGDASFELEMPVVLQAHGAQAETDSAGAQNSKDKQLAIKRTSEVAREEPPSRGSPDLDGVGEIRRSIPFRWGT